MTSEALLSKYFDQLAVEQLKPETCALLNTFRINVFSADEAEKRDAIFALARTDNQECQQLTLLWTMFFFEAQTAGLYGAINGPLIIEALLRILYHHWTSVKPYNAALTLALLKLCKPVFYEKNTLFHGLSHLLVRVKDNGDFNQEFYELLKRFYEDYKVLDKFVAVDQYNQQDHEQLQRMFKHLLVQYELLKKYFDDEGKETGLKPETHALLKAFRAEGSANRRSSAYVSFPKLPTVQALLALDNDEYKKLTIVWTRFFFEARRLHVNNIILDAHVIIDELLIALYNNKKSINESTLLALLEVFEPFFYYKNSVVRYFIGILEKVRKKGGFSPELLAKVTDFYEKYRVLTVRRYDEKEHQELAVRIKALLTAPEAAPEALPFDNKIGDRFSFYGSDSSEVNSAGWPARIAADIAALPPAEQQAWNILWAYAATADGGSPKAAWIKKGKELVAAVDAFSSKAGQWLVYVLDDVKDNDVPLSNAFSDANKQAIKGLIWLCSLAGDDDLAAPLADMANFGYSKAYGVGARAPAVANAALYALGLLGAQGVVQLSKLRSRVKFATGLKLIEKALAQAAERQGMSQDDLEELSVPHFGLAANHRKRTSFGNYGVDVSLTGSKQLQEQWWNRQDGGLLKKMPAGIKQDYRTEFKAWQKDLTDIQDVLTGQIKRLEDSYLLRRQWRFKDWHARFIQHPLLSWLGKQLIWTFEHDGQTQHGLYSSGQLVNVQQQPLPALADEAVVTLWHPIVSSVDEVQQWRALLTRHQIVQPIKQAYREVYFITPAEIETGDYSNRFAGHVLKQHHFAALCKERGWGYRLQGSFDSHNQPGKGLGKWQMGVTLELSTGGQTTAAGLYQYVTTAAVRFQSPTGMIPLVDVPALVFSEMMRDIDMFVGVTSIGTELAMTMATDDAHADYINAFSKAELSARALVRKDVLGNLVSKLAIAPRCSFDTRHLIVKGDIRTYKIHLASSNILMEPNDQYLCIVPSSKQTAASTEGLYLPFEGDHVLSVILSKALLLAADKKIKDASILSQIHRV